MVRGIFGELYATDAADAAARRLIKILEGEGPIEQRRRAVVALSAMQRPTDDPPAELGKVFSKAPEPVRVEIARAFGIDAVHPVEWVDALAPHIGQASALELLGMAAAGPAARRLSGQVQQQLDHGTVEDRYYALQALFEIDRDAWRTYLPSLSKDPDIAIALTAITLANEQGAASLALAMKAREAHWYPGLARMAPQDLIHAISDEPPVLGGLELIVSNDARYASKLASVCGTDPPVAARHPQSLWHRPQTIDLASEYADVSDLGIVAALRTTSGWFTGMDGGEFGGDILYTPDDKPGYLVEHVNAEPLVIFAWQGGHYAIAGGQFTRQWTWPRLDRLEVVDGKFKALPLINLPAVPTDVIDRDGRLLLRLQDNGWVDLTDPKAPEWLGCKPM